MISLPLGSDRDDQPHEDHIVVLDGATWADYQRLLEIRGDRARPRLTFSEDLLEIMSPSIDHELVKSLIGCLVEVYCLEAGIEFSTCGSWTLEDKPLRRGIEPDECYVFGPARSRSRPDLAIEVVWTSGGVSKLDVYAALGVREVWFWRRGVVTPYVLAGDGYEPREQSAALPGIVLADLAQFLDRPTTSEAMRAYRDALRARSSP
jgi:Uma2 family endonuclease